MEMIFDTTSQIPKITLKIRNIVDNPSMEPRGGDFYQLKHLKQEKNHMSSSRN